MCRAQTGASWLAAAPARRRYSQQQQQRLSFVLLFYSDSIRTKSTMPRAAFEASTLLGFTAKKVSSAVVCSSDKAVELPAMVMVWCSARLRGTTGYFCATIYVDTAAVGQFRLLSSVRHDEENDKARRAARARVLSLHRRTPASVLPCSLPCNLACKRRQSSTQSDHNATHNKNTGHTFRS